jgi:isoamylase
MKQTYSIDKNDRKQYPMGAVSVEGGMHISFASRAASCSLVLYRKGSKKPEAELAFPREGRQGDVWGMTVLGDFSEMEYTLKEDGAERPDPYGRSFSGCSQWAVRGTQIRTSLSQQESFDWQGDVLPCIPYEDSILYHIHTRGFTKHASSQVEPKLRGTFKGVEEKIPYIKELGATTIEMMPPAEFEELIMPDKAECDFCEMMGEEPPKPRMNYWGYVPALSFAPKAAFAAAEDAAREFKELVRALHREGMELIIELYFDGTQPPSYVLDAVRFWAREYHVDGVHLVGYAPLELLANDPYLSRLKLFAGSWENVDFGPVRHLSDYNEGFLSDMRGFLKGDEGKLNSVARHIRLNPEKKACIHYMANTNGFTLMDMVSYNKKHNEENGEDNRDGTDFNQSWNCGEEGPTRKKKILSMRRRQLRNALLMLFLSQGTPLLMAGDEFGRTKKGNNNSYCQDNEISWLNWGLLKSNRDIYEFTKQVIAFRKAHPIFHMEKEPALLDYKSVGMPDMSYHGVKTWCPEFEDFRRQLGVFYCGQYAKKPDGSSEDYFYVAYNMHWEPHEFALPNLPKNMKWHLAFDTADEAANGFCPDEERTPLKQQKNVLVMARSIIVLIGKEEDHVK